MRRAPSRPRVFGAGLIALDVVVSANPETPLRSFAGGTCGNVLAILAFLGWEVYPIARLNGDAASERVKGDLTRWGVRLKHAVCDPTADTPIIIQKILRGGDGTPKHRFSCVCPRCGKWLPGFKAVTRQAVGPILQDLPGAAVFFMDRLSRAILAIAAEASRLGAVVIYEPSGRFDPRLAAEALSLAHIVKYADSRIEQLEGAMGPRTATLLEVQTQGAAGLRYRHRLSGQRSGWRRLKAVPAPRLADSCGSGDWCTAGLLSKLTSGGYENLVAADVKEVEAALRYGQALAAWNCGFEGARGGMYACDRNTFDEQIARVLTGEFDSAACPEPQEIDEAALVCPGCTGPNPGLVRPHGSKRLSHTSKQAQGSPKLRSGIAGAR